MAERGLNAEMKEIAERAGVGIGTIYRNFATKDDLVTAVLQEVLCTFEQAMDDAEQISDPFESILLLFRRGWRIAEEHGELISELHEAGLSAHPEVERADQRAKAFVQRAAASGHVRQDVPVGLLADFLDIVMPWLYLQLRRRGWGAEETADAAEKLLLSAIFGTTRSKEA